MAGQAAIAVGLTILPKAEGGGTIQILPQAAREPKFGRLQVTWSPLSNLLDEHGPAVLGGMAHNQREQRLMVRIGREWTVEMEPCATSSVRAPEARGAHGSPAGLLFDYLTSIVQMRMSLAMQAVAARQLLDLLAFCLNPDRDEQIVPGMQSASRFAAVKCLIHARLGDRALSAGRLGQLLGVAPGQVRRLFAPLGGVGPYIEDCRLFQARRALYEHPDISVDRVARDCGFGSVTTFRRKFRNRFGISPRHGGVNAGQDGDCGADFSTGCVIEPGGANRP